MKIVKNNTEIVCDVRGCNRIASYKLIMDIGDHDEIRLCEKCLKSFYKAASESILKEEKNCGRKKSDNTKKGSGQ